MLAYIIHSHTFARYDCSVTLVRGEEDPSIHVRVECTGFQVHKVKIIQYGYFRTASLFMV